MEHKSIIRRIVEPRRASSPSGKPPAVAALRPRVDSNGRALPRAADDTAWDEV